MMKRDDFSLALNTLLPGCDPEAVSGWAEFANECVESGQFVHSIPAEHDAAVEKWLDTVFMGLCAVKQEYGPEIAVKLAELSCQRCALYPGEMLSVAQVLENGGDAERINAMIDSGDLEAEEPPFFDLPDGAALTRQGQEIGIKQFGVSCGLFQKRIEPGFLLADGTVLLESERDSFGRYRGGAGMDGVFLQTGKLYAPIRGADGQPCAFQEVKPVTTQEREAAFHAAQGDALKAVPPRDVEEVIAGMRAETIREIGNERITAAAQVAWYWTYIGALDMAQELGLIDDARRQALYREAKQFKPVCEIKRLQEVKPENYLAATEMGTEQNYNQIDGVINNVAPKPPSLRDTLKRCQEEVDRSKDGDTPGKPRQKQER